MSASATRGTIIKGGIAQKHGKEAGIAREAAKALLESMSISPAVLVLIAAAAFLSVKALKTNPHGRAL